MNVQDPFFKVRLTTVREILPHPKPEVHSLEIAKVYDFEVVVRKGLYLVNDPVFYVPVNSLLPQWLEDYLFPPDSKIKLDKHRIKAIRIQGFVSQGMLIPFKDAQEACTRNKKFLDAPKMEEDYKDVLEISKYEASSILDKAPQVALSKTRKKVFNNPNFKEYNGLDNIKYYPDIFKENEMVYISEKIHGTNFRAGWVPYVPPSIHLDTNVPGSAWSRPFRKTAKYFKFFGAKIKHALKKAFRLYPNWEFVYGSNCVQLQNKDYNGFYNSNIYLEAVEKYNLREKLAKGEVVYGEIYGDGVQKNYAYECQPGERKIVLFDLMCIDSINGTYTWRPRYELMNLCSHEDLPMVPELYVGPWDKEIAKSLLVGNSALAPSQKIREGIVIKNVVDYTQNRKAFKWISPDYLMKETTNETTDHK